MSNKSPFHSHTGCLLIEMNAGRLTVEAEALHAQGGYTLIELMVVVALVGIIAAITLPSTTSIMRGYRLKGDAQAVKSLVSLAKARAASQFSRARVFVDLNTNSFSFQTWDKTANSWVTEGGATRTSLGVAFGVSDLTVAPPNTQVAIGQSPLCKDDAGADIAATACVTFNSRGMPVDNSLPPAGGVVGNSALYLTDGSAVYATTVTTTPLIRSWWSRVGTAAWVIQ